MNNCEILKNAVTIAVVGISSNPDKTSRNIARYLVKSGYKVYGINPNSEGEDFDGIKIYASLRDINESIDIVDVFRKSQDIPDLIEDVLEIKPKVLWLQAGIRNDAAVKLVEEAGITTIQDTCIYVEHSGCF